VSERVRAEIVVRGRVQGVFFRGSAQQEGLRLGLTGQVRNLPDGSVEAIVEGDEKAVEGFVAWCRRGPPSAEVDGVQVKLLPPRGEFRTFKVAH
jgi:acylphosphatase